MSLVDENSKDSIKSVVNRLLDCTNTDQQPDDYSYWKPCENNNGMTELGHVLTSVKGSDSKLFTVPYHEVPEFYEEIEITTEMNASYTTDSRTYKNQPFVSSSLDYQSLGLHSKVQSLLEAISSDFAVDNLNDVTQTFERGSLPPSMNSQVWEYYPAQEFSPQMIANYANNNSITHTASSSSAEEIKFSTQDLSPPNSGFDLLSTSNTFSTCENQSSEQDSLSLHKSTDSIKDSLSKMLIWQTKKLDNPSADNSNDMNGSNGKPQHVFPIPDRERVYRDAWHLNQHLDYHSGEKNVSERFEREEHFAVHVQGHMDFNQTMPENGNLSNQVLDCHQEKDTFCDVNADHVIDSLKREIQHSIPDLVLPTLDFEVPNCNLVTEAVVEESTDYSKNSLDYIANCTLDEHTRVSTQDLQASLLPMSKVFSTCKTRHYVQDFPTVVRPVTSSKNSINDMRVFKKENHGKAEDCNEMKDYSGTLRYVCSIPNCEGVYRHPGHFNLHLNWHSGKHRFFCAHCGKGFVRKDALCFHVQKHMREYEKLEEYQFPNGCVDGGKETKEKTICHVIDRERLSRFVPNLKMHLTKHTDNNNIFCAYCNKKFELVDDLSKHVKEHVGQVSQSLFIPESRASKMVKRMKCQCSNCSVEGGIKIKDSNGRSLHVCHVPGCGKVFKRTEHLKRHLDWHSDKKNFVCVHCYKGFIRKDYLIRHVKSHMFGKHQKQYHHQKSICKNGNKLTGTDGKSQYACHIPNRNRDSTEARDLKSHLVSHNVIKDFICIYCDKGFESKDILDHHVKTHYINERNELKNDDVDSYVSQSFIVRNEEISQKNQLTRYQCPDSRVKDSNKTRSPGDKLQHICHVTDCGRASNVVPSLKMHLERHTENKNFFCGYCKQKFVFISDLRKHVQGHVNLSHSRLKKDNEVSKCCRDIDTLTDLSADSIVDSLNCEIQPTVQGSLSPPRDSENSENNPVIEAMSEVSANDSKDLGKNTMLSNSQLYPILPSTSKTPPTPGTRYSAQGPLIPLRLVHSSTNSTNDMLIIKGENLQNRKNTSCSADDGNKIKGYSGAPSYICPTPNCGKVYKNAGNFKAHLDWHSGKNFFCTLCNKRFGYKLHLDKHIKSHTSINRNCIVEGGIKIKNPNGRSPHICHVPNCGKVFTKSNCLKIHLKSHSGVKDFICSYCDKGFTRKYNFNEHIKMHTSIEPKKLHSEKKNFFCSYCGKGFTRKYNLNNHVKIHTSFKKNFICSYCDKGFTRNYNLNNHIKIHTAIKPEKFNGKLEFVSPILDLERVRGNPEDMKNNLEWPNDI